MSCLLEDRRYLAFIIPHDTTAIFTLEMNCPSPTKVLKVHLDRWSATQPFFALSCSAPPHKMNITWRHKEQLCSRLQIDGWTNCLTQTPYAVFTLREIIDLKRIIRQITLLRWIVHLQHENGQSMLVANMRLDQEVPQTHKFMELQRVI